MTFPPVEQAEFLGAIDTSESFYKPKTKLTKVAYEQLLSFVQVSDLWLVYPEYC